MKNSGVDRLSPHDSRDYVYAAAYPTADAAIIPLTDHIISTRTEKVWDQGPYGMCVSFAKAEIRQQWIRKKYGIDIKLAEGFIYRNREPSDLMYLFNTNGMIPREACKHLLNDGVCVKEQYPWEGNWQPIPDLEKKVEPVPASLRPLAKKYRIEEYFQLHGAAEIMAFIKNHNVGVEIIVPVAPNFIGDYIEVKSDAWIEENKRGYHAVIVEGWKYYNGLWYWVVKNSWSRKWGKYNGYCFLPMNKYTISEAWGLVDKEQLPPYWHVQIGAFAKKAGAEVAKQSLVDLGYSTYIVKIYDDRLKKDLYKVQVGAYFNEGGAKATLNKMVNDDALASLNYGTPIMKRY